MTIDYEDGAETLTVHIPMTFERRGGRKLVIAPESIPHQEKKPERDERLVRALVKAHRWRRRIEGGGAKSITDLAAQEGVTDAYVCRLLPLTTLTPDLVEVILDGRQPKGMKLSALLRLIPANWDEQRHLLITDGQ